MSSADQSDDQKFFNLFMVVIGALIGVTVFLIFLARSIATDSQVAWVKQDPSYAKAVDERIKPAAHVSLPGDESAAGAVAMTALPVAAPVAAKLTGEQVYNAACFACHGSGVGGAPKFRDAAAWQPRV
ncbi:MAG: c-type cytochrome, partial [Gammaproteobacteria bacterium]